MNAPDTVRTQVLLTLDTLERLDTVQDSSMALYSLRLLLTHQLGTILAATKTSSQGAHSPLHELHTIVQDAFDILPTDVFRKIPSCLLEDIHLQLQLTDILVHDAVQPVNRIQTYLT